MEHASLEHLALTIVARTNVAHVVCKVVLALSILITSGAAFAAFANEKLAPSGYPVPRFVSLKSDPVNLRKGPGTEYPKSWVYRQAGLPVEIIQEYGDWRRVRDASGVEGWVYRSLLSGRRTALIRPWEKHQAERRRSAKLVRGRSALNGGAPPTLSMTPMKRSDSARSRTIARLEAGTLLTVMSCSQVWCEVQIGDYSGYVEKTELWGVYADEKIN